MQSEREESMTLDDGQPRLERKEKGEEPIEGGKRLSIVVASTFTIALLMRPMEFWLDRLNISAEVHLAPYGQLMMQLLDRNSVVNRIRNGYIVLLIRLEDWVRDLQRSTSPLEIIEHLLRTAREFAAAVEEVVTRTGAPVLVLFCPVSSSRSAEQRLVIDGIQRDLRSRLGDKPGIHCISHSELVDLYPVAQYEDLIADNIGHVPYTTEYFVALATLITRRICSQILSPRKVIAVDCDQTLWRGICGEDGPSGVEVTPARVKFQETLVAQYKAGVLLCLCSKNDPSDVEAVFQQRSDMPLRKEHFVASRVNWDPKSSNLMSLAQELNVALDSFIFVDDSPVECAEVSSECRGVLALQFPIDEDAIVRFTNHAWAFDKPVATEDGGRRNAQYKENRLREQALECAPSLTEFLASLELKVDVSLMEERDLERVAELSLRTNQFNATGVRRRAPEIRSLCGSRNYECHVVHVRDRFGDYGLVGAVLVSVGEERLKVEMFVLSCRVLGRGVEFRIVQELGRIAKRRGLEKIVLRFVPTGRNGLVLEFLEGVFASCASECDSQDGCKTFAVSVDDAERLKVEPEMVANRVEKRASGATRGWEDDRAKQWHEVAYRLTRVSDVVIAMGGTRSAEQRGTGEYVAPRTRTERAIAEIWEDILKQPKVGIGEDFFELGGDSLLAVQAVSRIGSSFGLEISLHEFFEAPTVAKLAEIVASASEVEQPIPRIDRSIPVPLSWAQQRLWFIDELEGASVAYHIPVALRLSGQLHRAALAHTFDEVMRRHEILRTSFAKVGGRPVQQVATELPFPLRMVEVKSLHGRAQEEEICSHILGEMSARFDLSVGPLVRGLLIQVADHEHVLLIVIHHIVADGWSVGVLLREVASLYRSHVRGESDPLPALPTQYAEYSVWQRQWLTEKRTQKELVYWRSHLQDAPQLLELPTDRPRPPVRSYRGGGCKNLHSGWSGRSGEIALY